MKRNVIIKGFFYCLITSIICFLYKLVINIKYMDHVVNQKGTQKYIPENFVNMTETMSKFDLKYILQWTSPKTVPFVYMGVGQEGFITRNCTYINCFVTADRSYLSDLTKFDAIVFAGPQARFLHLGHRNLPNKRALNQKYVYASIESADNYPMCSDHYDGFYNWTWTYRLDSDAMWGYMAIRDSEKKVIGPKRIMHWMKLEDMEPISEETKKKLKNKKKAVAWFVSNCRARSGREVFVDNLKMYLKKYNLTIDIYGKCSKGKTCHEETDNCSKMIEDDYYFYLSFENSFAEDYVTEKLLRALKNYAIPIVYGGANYTRFMPDGIYLNARELGPEKLAGKINELIKNPDLYAEYFKWKKYYTYHYRFESIETDDYCAFCTLLNNEKAIKTTTVYNNFRHWWNPPNRCN